MHVNLFEKGIKSKSPVPIVEGKWPIPKLGKKSSQSLCDELEDVATPESEPKFLGRTLTVILAPGSKKKKEPAKPQAKPEEKAKNTREQS